MMRSKPPVRWHIVLLLFFLVTIVVFAGPSATLTGTVQDSHYVAITGVKVEATNSETGVLYWGETNGDGVFHIPNIPDGTYQVIVKKFGFRTVYNTGVKPPLF